MFSGIKLNAGPLIALAGVLCFALPATAGAEEFKIKTAGWKAEKQLLTVQGNKVPKKAQVTISNAGTGTLLGQTTANSKGNWTFKLSKPSSVPCRVRAVVGQSSAEKNVEKAPSNCAGGGGGGGGNSNGTSINSTGQNALALKSPVPVQPAGGNSGFQIIAANDLGMHCSDLDHQVVSILPPFNVVHAQAIRKGTANSDPQVLKDDVVDVVYSAVSNPADPVNAKPAVVPVFKTNFWSINPNTGKTYGYDAYDPLYPQGVLQLFPLDPDRGLPGPDLAELYLGTGQLTAGQQKMPGISNAFVANTPQRFDRFDTDIPFFKNLPFGSVVQNVNWFAADGIPILPIDDQGRENPYPLMRVQALDKTGSLTGTAGKALASVDVVLPVSWEAQCNNCHTDPIDGGNGAAAKLAENGSPRSHTPFSVTVSIDAPGDTDGQRLLNAAKINALRLHDAKHGTQLDAARPVVCATCHYSPALDLAHLGPNDSNGKQQTKHHSMSNVMHAHHGQFTDLFPEIPAPGTNAAARQQVVDQTCYQCHPGKSTQCLRGAMFSSGVQCQDCHGNMAQLGNDFSKGVSPGTPGAFDLSGALRVPWADEPACGSCHTGDAINNMSGMSGVLASSDMIRLIQAYKVGDPSARPIKASNTRFAENERLYRISKGHGGLMCEGCHGSTHAIWPVKPDSGVYIANDNMAAQQLQGHSGTLTECTACHQAGTLGVNLDGPHGMHAVADTNFIKKHEDLFEKNRQACQACHGLNLEGTVLSRAAANRTLPGDDGKTVTLAKGTKVSCTLCHENPLNHD